ncbi:MBL fold metallo-hydrolase [Rossellomorea aquimaris]|uniref:MBL fold metallo-hydrolase n=1 Tax=Rossellomorea aquimaris TaxID=189382 RepID=A0A1J6W6U4_9BACI|nr:MBL fold metallo-hydrolase [Rossellomorea aquimaris]OIU72396.1 MBL fold metallo-hydrolase [Rossellomorea aquimaris]
MMCVERLDSRISLVDLMDLSLKGRTGSYVIHEESIAIVETSASPSIPHLKKGLSKLNIKLEDIQYIILTHIHLDHAGGAGLLLEECPSATIVVHPKGYRHLNDPSRLIAGAKAVYGEDFERLFSPVKPIPKERMVVKGHGDTLRLSETCTLTFYDTPGHANHHFSIYDPVSEGMFTGDTCGIQYRNDGKSIYLPSTSPNQFSPDAIKESMHFFKDKSLRRIYFGHYGMTEEPVHALSEVDAWLDRFMAVAEAVFSPDSSFNDNSENLSTELYNLVKNSFVHDGIEPDHPLFNVLELDMKVSAMGIVDYLTRKGELKS